MSLRDTLLGLLLAALGYASASPAWLEPSSVLAPRSPAAARISELWWFLFITAAIVFVVVTGLLIVGLFRRGREVTSGGETNDDKVTPLLIFGSAATAVILIVVAAYTFLAMAVLAAPAEAPKHTFEVVGKQWWWEVRFEGETINANEIHIPVGEPVLVRLLSDNVIHSFWVPELSGKRDLIPGHPNTLWLQADRPGVYRGLCAEYCGLQHANMAFVVVAEPLEAFAVWLERVQSPANEPVTDEQAAGQAVFMSHCAGCHAIRGTAARVSSAPTSPTWRVASPWGRRPSPTPRATWAAGSSTRTRSNPATSCPRRTWLPTTCRRCSPICST